MERTTVRLPSELLDRAKRRAVAQGRTLTSLIEEGLLFVVGENRNALKQKRIMPRVSKAKGGVRPGIDLEDFSLLQEMDDRDTMRRTKRLK